MWVPGFKISGCWRKKPDGAHSRSDVSNFPRFYGRVPSRRSKMPIAMISVLTARAHVAGTAGLLWYIVMPP